ncbi:MAG: TetR/AcrR family transcriptional regulator [Acidimicrobiia bacterium]
MATQSAVGEESETRARILDAAIECFTQFGNDKTTLNDVARVAGLARQTIYRYFPDRAALLVAVDELEDERLRREAAEIGEQSSSFEEFLARFVEARAETSVRYRTRQHLRERDRGLLTSMFLSQGQRVDFLRQLVKPQLEAARDRGELRTDLAIDEASEWIAISILSLNQLTSVASFDIDDPAATGRFVARYVCRGLLGISAAGADAGRAGARAGRH